MDGHYEFIFSEPGEKINIEIRLVRSGQTVLTAVLQGEGRELCTARLWATVLRYPFSAALTFPRILWQAALLRFRHRLPVFKHPPPESPMTLIGRTP
jgi:cyclopropane-fatty-acyl-phospholipid synthase